MKQIRRQLLIKRLSDLKQFEVYKYVLDDGGSQFVWCKEWKGIHKIGDDCVFTYMSSKKADFKYG